MLNDQKSKAIARLDLYLKNRPKSRCLGSADREKLRQRGFLVCSAWETTLHVDDGEIPATIIIDDGYPYTTPKIVVSAQEFYLKIPHVADDGSLCLLPDYAIFSHAQIESVIAFLLEDAERLLAQGWSGKNRVDFVDEFQNYWPGTYSTLPRFQNIVGIIPRTRILSVVKVKVGNRYLFGDTHENCTRWLKNRYENPPDIKTSKALFIWLNEPLFPEQYPGKGADLQGLIDKLSPEEMSLFYEVVPVNYTPLPLLIGFSTGNGPAVGGVLAYPMVNRKGIPEVSGFRKGKAPKNLIAPLYLGNNDVLRLSVERSDPEWIHTRGGIAESLALFSKKVCIIGCGSLGADIALLLAKAGVSKLQLIDGDTLSFDNIGRHVLGASDVGMRKDAALAKYLKHQLPHLNVEHYSELNWQALYKKHPDIFKDTDVIVSATANWSSDDHLNYLNRNNLDFPPLIFSWYEPHGCAGHVLSVLDIGGCLTCGVDDLGRFCRQVTVWPNGTTLRQSPACGAYYQPYGVLETSPVKAMAAELAIDVLLGRVRKSELRSWVGSYSNLEACGGKWQDDWVNLHGHPQDGRILIREEWKIHENCPQCH